MRILGPSFVRAFPDRIVNTHPSLLPAFRGAHAVRDALAYGVKVTGCTVHLVDEEVDHGPVLFQAPVPVEPGDDEDRLHQRIKATEHRLLPLAVRLLAQGRVRVEGRRARIADPEEVPR
jgi:phosphoribosylglycinamide formyltransferase-1